MKVLIDADGCPVVDLAVQLCNAFRVQCVILCDTAHELSYHSAEILTLDKGTDSVDFALVNRVNPGDLVITQDYGLASMCIAKQARVLHQDGWEYTQYNMDALLFQRYATRKFRASGGHMKGPSKRNQAQNESFKNTLTQILSKLSKEKLEAAPIENSFSYPLQDGKKTGSMTTMQSHNCLD